MQRLREYITNLPFLSLIASNVYAIVSHVLAVPWRLKALTHAHISITTKIIGWRALKLGNNCVISSGTWINVGNRQVKNEYKIKIGNNSFIGRNNFFTVGNEITIGPFCLTASNCSFIGTSHIITNPTKPYISTGVTENWRIAVGANCFFGYDASIIGNVTVGHGCVIGAHCKVMSDIPPFSMVVGNPGRVIKRFDFLKKEWIRLNEYDESKSSIPSENEYIKQLEDVSIEKYPFMPVSVSNIFFGDIN